MNAMIISLILAMAPYFGIKPELALAIAKQESSLNPRAVGSIGEVGIFQIRPRYSKFSRDELSIIPINIVEGLRMLAFAKKHCKHQVDYTFIICYNRGVAGGAKVKHPYKDDYYVRVMKRLKGIK